MVDSITLSQNDSTVLNQLFDAESSSSNITISPHLPADPHIRNPDLLAHLKQLEISAIHLAESCDLSSALQLLDGLIEEHPAYASAYNNRAQVLRLMNCPTTQVLSDLSRAIDLASPETAGAAVSEFQARLLAQAYTQRATIYYGIFKAGERAPVGLEKRDMEEAASRDFWNGGRYGNSIAREMAVRTNPYARLCGAIVKEAMRKEYEVGV